MALFSERRDDCLMLRPLGQWDETMQHEVEAQVLGQGAIGVQSFVIDLCGTEHIKFKVIPALLELAERIGKYGGDLVIASPSPYLLEILAAGDVPRRIPVFPSEASAALGVKSPSVAILSYLQDGERETTETASRAVATVPGR
ncbi:MAG: STAS domain-containing protein [bacterium]|nr:STAS domain-containing protein [bacterium]